MRISNPIERGDDGERMFGGSTEWRQWLQDIIQRLPFRLRNLEPEVEVGTRVLVTAGEARNDMGQMAVVSRRAGSQVEITCCGPTGLLKTRRKQPSSLIRLEEGLEMVMDENGWPVIRRMIPVDKEGDETHIGLVSEDEGRAQ
jgi:hypothetical protein